MNDLPAEPSPLTQLIVWSRLGVQSFGGGTATLALIRRAIVDERHWLTEDEFTRYWALVLMVPGINLLGLTILAGRKIGGTVGIIMALAGLLLPSVAITIFMTALYARFEHSKIVVSALAGVIPATVGVGIFTGWQIALPVLRTCRTCGAKSLAIAIMLFVGSALMEVFAHLPVAVLLLLSGAIGALTQFAGAPKREELE